MADISNADLHALGRNLTDAIRHEVGTLRAETLRIERGVYRRIDELKAKQDEQNGRVNRHEARLDILAEEPLRTEQRLEGIETRVVDVHVKLCQIEERQRLRWNAIGDKRSFWQTLSKKQKAAAFSAAASAAGVAADGIHHLTTFVRLVVTALSAGGHP